MKKSVEKRNQIARGTVETVSVNMNNTSVNYKINKVCGILLVICLSVSAFCYYFVISSENTLNILRKETVELNAENTDLQNKLDSLKSYYYVDKTMKESNLLHKAQKTMKVSEVILPVVNIHQNRSRNIPTKSLGY